MAGGTVGSQIGFDAMRQTRVFLSHGSHCGSRRRAAIQTSLQVTRLGQPVQLMDTRSITDRLKIKLSGLKPKHPSGRLVVAGQAFTATRKAPGLIDPLISILNPEGRIFTLGRHQEGLILGLIPPIGHPIDSSIVAHQQSRLQSMKG